MTFLKEQRVRATASKPKKSKRTSKKAAHDTGVPKALLDFMVTDWAPPSPRLPKPIQGHTYFAKRREVLSEKFKGELLVIPTGHEKVRANDTNYPFRPSSDFYYLTGNLEPDCVLVMVPEKSGHRHILFVEPNEGKSDKTFFTDRVKGELWVGARLGVPQSKARYQVDECRGLGELKDFLKEYKSKKKRRVLRGFSASVESFLGATNREHDAELAQVLSEMRLIKDSLEVRELQGAIDSTHRAFEDVVAKLPGVTVEREIEVTFFARARVEGNDVGYGTIAACGEHACTLHWTRNDGVVNRDDLMLLDAGVEAKTLYTADITRTVPISGTFKHSQLEVYDLVVASQEAAFKEVKPGNDFLAPNRAAMKVLAQGLIDMGILKCSLDEALDENNQFYKRYTLHNVSHMLGLDVHDCARARQESYKLGKLEQGMVLTVEPGLYFQPDDLTVPSRYRGIGVRIEDDVLVTARGCKILSAAFPRSSKDIEAWMRDIWKRENVNYTPPMRAAGVAVKLV